VASPVGGVREIKPGRSRVENRPDTDTPSHHHNEEGMSAAVIVDEAELGQLATLIARLSPGQQQLVAALADGFRGGWLEPLQWERAWRGSDLTDDAVLCDARFWLARRPGRPRNLLHQAE
jgi:hypothetical protein